MPRSRSLARVPRGLRGKKLPQAPGTCWGTRGGFFGARGANVHVYGKRVVGLRWVMASGKKRGAIRAGDPSHKRPPWQRVLLRGGDEALAGEAAKDALDDDTVKARLVELLFEYLRSRQGAGCDRGDELMFELLALEGL